MPNFSTLLGLLCWVMIFPLKLGSSVILTVVDSINSQQSHTIRGIPAHWIGSYGRPQTSSTARVIGSTSRGIFLLHSKNCILFLSIESYRGPFTINLSGGPDDWQAVQIGSKAALTPYLIQFPETKQNVDLTSAALWRPPVRPESEAPPQSRLELLAQMSNLLSALPDTFGAANLLSIAAGLNNHPPLPSDYAQFAMLFQQFTAAWNDPDVATRIHSAVELIGHGSGLTPTGDDVLCGLLLTLGRWGNLNQHQTFAESVVQTAHLKTTALSANLLQAAVEGQADERLITAVDQIMTVSASPEEILQTLGAYGSSSGYDALAGMALGISTFK
jgi:hypothetical protein